MRNKKPDLNPYTMTDRANTLMSRVDRINHSLSAAVVILSVALVAGFFWKPIAWVSSVGASIGSPANQFYIDVAMDFLQRRYTYTPISLKRGQYRNSFNMIHPRTGVKLKGEMERDRKRAIDRSINSNYSFTGEIKVVSLDGADKEIVVLARQEMFEGEVSIRDSLFKATVVLRPAAGNPFGMLIMDQYQQRVGNSSSTKEGN